jgi:hypothetical protein
MESRILPMSRWRLRANVARLADTMQALSASMEDAARNAERAAGLGVRTVCLREGAMAAFRARRPRRRVVD